VFFDPNLDSFSPADEAGKADKSRRQKALSTYGAALELSASDEKGAKNVAAFIEENGGIEASRIKWKGIQDGSEEAQKAEAKAKETRQKTFDTGLAALKAAKTASLRHLGITLR